MKFSSKYKILLFILIATLFSNISFASDNILFSEIKHLEDNFYKSKIRIGFHAMDLDSGRSIGYRNNESFIMASTVKVPVSIYLMNQVDEGNIDLAKMIYIDKSDLVPGSGKIGYFLTHDGLAISNANLLELMMAISDNTATDLIIRQLGMNNIAKFFNSYPDISLKHNIMQLFDIYYNLNHKSDKSLFEQIAEYRSRSNDITAKYAKDFYYNKADRTTPKAMALILKDFMDGKFTSIKSRDFLLKVMSHTENKDRLKKEVLHSSDFIHHKTGTFDYYSNKFAFVSIADVGIVKLKSCKKIIISLYLDSVDTELNAKDLEQVLSIAARIITDYFLFS
ncbi:MAG: hypothetical protein BGO27_08315 [Alphaproteobacteria bacterium 33-17]|nr:MAG: hypothetical protein BGO27_08315 [Alphaproteobacteria bacterium 33-17]